MSRFYALISKQLNRASNGNFIRHRMLHQENVVKIGCASGFWGDTSVAAPQLVNHGDIDYLVFDYLSEITMSILARAKQKNPKLGYAPDFLNDAILPLLSKIKEKGIKVISNAGGINPLACAEEVKKACEKYDIDLNIAVVTGDDIMTQLDQVKHNHPSKEFPNKIVTMNAYLGAGPIARALDLGADIVITGRCVDSALALAPLLHEFKWDFNDFNLLAAGSIAGHLIECGAQVSGGIFTDWELVPNWEEIGFPIVEVERNGNLVITKTPNTGGLVADATVAEQIVYEIGDPCNYELPDVNCDFSKVTLEQILGRSDAVFVKDVTGKKPSDFYKVCATYMDGYRSTAVTPIIGPDSVKKGERVANSILNRCRNIYNLLGLEDFKRVNIETLGSENTYGPAQRGNSFTRECVLWIAVEHNQKQALDIFAKEIAPAGTGMAPGLTYIVGGRPSVSPVLKLYSFLHPKSCFNINIHMNGNHIEQYREPESIKDDLIVKNEPVNENNLLIRRVLKRRGKCSFPLGALAYTRSGDKGNDANIGVICRNKGYYGILSDVLTSESVKEYFQYLFDDMENCEVIRYDLPGIYAFNFVLKNVLGGGGTASLRSDPQGKSFGQLLLDYKVKDVPDLLPSTYDRFGNV